jgi:hypothetical protein
MSLNNLISMSFEEQELEQINNALLTIENIIEDKVINLTPEEKQLYGKIGDKTENWVLKVSRYMMQKPELVPFYLNKEEFDRDQKARKEIMPLLNRISSLQESLDDTAKLLSTDVYNAALAYYRNIKLVAQQNVPGTSVIYEELSGQFPGRPSSVPEKSQDNNEEVSDQ